MNNLTSACHWPTNQSTHLIWMEFIEVSRTLQNRYEWLCVHSKTPSEKPAAIENVLVGAHCWPSSKWRRRAFQNVCIYHFQRIHLPNFKFASHMECGQWSLDIVMTHYFEWFFMKSKLELICHSGIVLTSGQIISIYRMWYALCAMTNCKLRSFFIHFIQLTGVVFIRNRFILSSGSSQWMFHIFHMPFYIQHCVI